MMEVGVTIVMFFNYHSHFEEIHQKSFNFCFSVFRGTFLIVSYMDRISYLDKLICLFGYFQFLFILLDYC